jgi:hypothetical protein
MNEKNISRVVAMLGICCALTLTPLTGQGADLVIGNSVSTTGNWTLNGIVTATSFTGSGSALTNVTASNLACSGCVSPSELTFVPGTITGVTPGTGLTGGGSSGNVTVGVNYAGSGLAGTAARSDHNHDALYLGKYGKVAIVAQSGGDYTDPLTAMDDSGSWCGTASDTNPCLVKIMPGVYDVGGGAVQMKDYIDIEGSGENTTKIKGNISNNASGVVRGATFAELRFLAVENTGGGGNDAIAMYNNQAAPKITNVTLTARNGGRNSTALYNSNLSLPLLTNVTLEAFDAASDCYGVYSTNLCNPRLTNVKIKTSGGFVNTGVASVSNVITTMENVTIESTGNSNSTSVKGAYISYSSILMTNSSIRCIGSSTSEAIGVETINNATGDISKSSIEAVGTGTTWAIAVISHISSTLKMENVRVEAKSGSLNIGVQNGSTGGNVAIDRSTIIGASSSIRNDSSTASFLVGASRIDGPALGTTVCVSSYNGSYAAVGTNCL